MLRSENFKYFVKFSFIFPSVQTNFFRAGGLLSRFSQQVLGGAARTAAPADIEPGLGGLTNHLKHGLSAERGELWDRLADISSSYVVQEKQHLLNYRLGLAKNLVVNLCKPLWSWKKPHWTTSNVYKSLFSSQSHFLHPYHKVFSFKSGKEQTLHPAEGQQSHQMGAALGGNGPQAEITLAKPTRHWQGLATHWWTSKDHV